MGRYLLLILVLFAWGVVFIGYGIVSLFERARLG